VLSTALMNIHTYEGMIYQIYQQTTHAGRLPL